MAEQLELGDITIEVVLKDIKNVHLSVNPPTGHVRVAAPRRMKMETIRLYAISKLDWIKSQQRRIRAQERETPRELLERESFDVWGKRYLLSVVEAEQRPCVTLEHNHMVLQVRYGSDLGKRRQVVEDWYREQVRAATVELISKWEPKVGVEVARLYVRRMKTRWGSCNSQARTIRLNTDLGRKPRECLEYIVVHEMVHILEPTHNERFQSLMNEFMPDWDHRRQVLNHLPVRHENWVY